VNSKPHEFYAWLPRLAVVKFSTIYGNATRRGPQVVHQTTISLATAKWKRIRNAEDFAGNRNAVSDTFELIDRSIGQSISLATVNEARSVIRRTVGH
jgi:hypothetical protein